MKKNRMNGIVNVYEMMKNVKKICFKANSVEGSQMGWNYVGEGNVVITEGQESLYFFEEVVLDNNMWCNDKKLWKFKKNCIEFYRFRDGDYEKIFEFLFCEGEFIVKREYLCSPDLYYGEINILDDGKICLLVKVKGEKKNEVLEYTYSR